MKEMSQAQLTELCENRTATTQAKRRDVECVVAGIIAREKGLECEFGRKRCLDADPDAWSGDECIWYTEDAAKDCEVTRAEFDVCVEAELADAEARLATLSCQTAFADVPDRNAPPECAALKERCPQLFSNFGY